MEIQNYHEMIIFIQDSRKLIRKVYLLCIFFFVFWFLVNLYTNTLFKFSPWIFLILFYLASTPTIIYAKNNKFIIEKLIYYHIEGVIQIRHDRNIEIIKKIFSIEQIEKIYYENLSVPLLSRNGENKKRIEEARYLKFKLKNGEIISFGLFLKKEEAEKIIQYIKL